MSEQLPSRMSVELSLAGGEPVEVCSGLPKPSPGAIGPERSASHLDRLAAAMAWFERLPPLLRSFLESLSGDRLDDTTIGAFADYLEEHGHTAEGQRVRLLRPQPGDLLVLWPADRSAAQRTYVRETAEQMRAALPVHTLECHDPDSRVESIDPEQLRAAGWVRESEAGDWAWEAAGGARQVCASLAEATAARFPDHPLVQRVLLALAEDIRSGRC